MKQPILLAMIAVAAASISVRGQSAPQDARLEVVQFEEGAKKKGATLPVVLGAPEQAPKNLAQPLKDQAQPPKVVTQPPKDLTAPPVVILDPAPCGPYGRIWGGAEYLGWWTKGFHVPPMVTTNPQGTSVTDAGILNRPSTSVLFGDSDVNGGYRSGARFTLGGWLNRDQTIGIEGTGFFLARSSTSFSVASSGNPILAVPFFDLDPRSAAFNNENAFLTAFPGIVKGSMDATTFSDFWGAEGNVWINLSCSPLRRLDFLIGYRHLNLNEGLTFHDLQDFTPSGFPVVIETRDSFQTTNHFNGVNLGLKCESWRGALFCQLIGKVALGSNERTVDIAGSNNSVIFGVTQPTTGGLFALPSNSGTFTSHAFSVVPEVGVNLGYQISPNLRAFAGYSFLYWTNVLRPGDQIDRGLNTSQAAHLTAGPGGFTGAARPAFPQQASDFWAHGVNIGLELRY